METIGNISGDPESVIEQLGGVLKELSFDTLCSFALRPAPLRMRRCLLQSKQGAAQCPQAQLRALVSLMKSICSFVTASHSAY